MIDDAELNAWFCREVLPHEGALTRFINRNWRTADDVVDIRQEVYALALNGARSGHPQQSRQYIYTIARNLIINRAKRAKIVSFDLFADFDDLDRDIDLFATHRHLEAREELRRTQAGLDGLRRDAARSFGYARSKG